jgi:hypothetical protein
MTVTKLPYEDLILNYCVENPNLTLREKGIIAMMLLLRRQHGNVMKRSLLYTWSEADDNRTIHRAMQHIEQLGIVEACRVNPESQFCYYFQFPEMTPERKKEYRNANQNISLNESCVTCVTDKSITYGERGLYLILLAHESGKNDESFIAKYTSDKFRRIQNTRKKLVEHEYLSYRMQVSQGHRI